MSERVAMSTPRLCSIPDCGKTHYGKGFCNMHYQRLRNQWDLLKTPKTACGEPWRFYQDVALTYEGNDCLTWPHSHAGGYGQIRVGGKKVRVGRLLCEAVHGPPPTQKHEASHSCGNGHLRCVTKRHLSWKTRTENKADELTHGTRNRGERHGAAKLTDAQAREILLLKGKFNKRQLAEKYGISPRRISSIQAGESWSWLQENSRSI